MFQQIRFARFSYSLVFGALVLAACGAQPAAQAPSPSEAPAAATDAPASTATTQPAPIASASPLQASATALPPRPTLDASATLPPVVPTSPPGGVTGEVPAELMDRIKADAAQRSGVAVDALVELMGQAVEWSDSSLGCPQPGMAYMQVITSGYQVMLQAGDATYDYHASQNDFLLCKPSS